MYFDMFSAFFAFIRRMRMGKKRGPPKENVTRRITKNINGGWHE